jgi:hypothetical protein
MKKLYLICFLLLGQLSWSQDMEKEKLQNLIQEFFVAFHAQDSATLKILAHPQIKMQSVAIDSVGNTSLSSIAYASFLKSIVSIDESIKFKEELHGFEININGMIANVSTPYSFYVNDQLSHCGVNTFQLMKSESQWKIIYLVDTRSKLGCQ